MKESLNLHLSLKIAGMLLVVSFSAGAHALEDPPLVEVEVQQDNLADYVDRRDVTGVYFGINYEAVDLKNYISVLDGKNQSYSAVFGSNTLPLIKVNFDYKWNTMIGSFAGGVDLGTGNLNSNKSGTNHDLKILRYGLGFKWTLDSFTKEPYVAPYLGINLWEMNIDEKTSTDSLSMTTGLGYNYSLGLLFQLDWLDYSAAKTSTFDWGLENTFLDVYATQYAKTMSDSDPNTSTDFLFGAGLRLEF